MKLGIQYRQYEVERVIDAEKRTVELTFSSETEVERYWGFEILDHGPKSVNLERLLNGGAVLDNHDRTRQIGVVDSAYIGNDKRGHATVRFSKSAFAEEIFNDVKDGIRKLVSVGYRIYEAILEKESETGQTYRITRWAPLEISLVSIPADITVGVGREAKEDLTEVTIINQRGEQMNEQHTNMQTSQDPPVQQPAVQQVVNRDQTVVNNPPLSDRQLNDINEILEMGSNFNMMTEAQTAIRGKKTADQFRAMILDKFKTQQNIDTNTANLGLSRDETRKYSIIAGIRALITGDWSRAGLEAEASRQIQKAMGQEPKGFFVPHEILQREITTASGGTGLIATQQLPQNFIEALRNKAVLMNIGAQSLTGLVGNIAVPKQSGAATAYWVSESGDVTGSDSAYTTVAMSPKTVGAATPYSRNMLLQSNPSIDMLVMKDLALVLAIAIDKAGFAGTGAPQPQGIIGTAGVGSVTGTTLGWAGVVEFETDITAANADLNAMYYVTNATVAGLLKTRVKETGYPIYLLEKKEMNGYPVAVTNQIPAANMIFGDYSQVLIGMWGGLDINVDLATLAASGGVVIRAFQSVDAAVRHAGAFSVSTNIT